MTRNKSKVIVGHHCLRYLRSKKESIGWRGIISLRNVVLAYELIITTALHCRICLIIRLFKLDIQLVKLGRYQVIWHKHICFHWCQNRLSVSRYLLVSVLSYWLLLYARAPLHVVDIMNVCRVAWQTLGSMVREDAMSEFVSFLRKSCPLFAPYVQAHVAERQERERKQWVADYVQCNI